MDELGRKLLASQQLKDDLRLGRVAAETTNSIEALKHFLEGEQYLRGFSRPLDSRRAEEHFDEAVSLDPSFALAWHRLSWAQMESGKTEEAFESSQKATHLGSGRLSLRDRRQLQVLDAWIHGNADDAEQLERKAIETYPDDLEAWTKLGEILFHMNGMRGRRPDEARQAFEQVLQLNRHETWALLHLRDLATEEGDLKQIEALFRYVDRPGGSPDLELARLFFSGQREAAIKSVQREQLFDALLWSVQAADFVSAERLLQLYQTETPSMRAYGLTQGAMIDVRRGRWKSAKERLDRAAAFDSSLSLTVRALLYGTPFLPAKDEELTRLLSSLNEWVQSGDQETNWAAEERRRLPRLKQYLIGLVASRLRSRPGIERAAAELRRNPPPIGSPTLDFEPVLAALLAQLDGDAGQALRSIEKARVWSSGPVYCSYPFGNYLHAELLLANGRLDEALRWFDSMIRVYGTQQSPFSAVARLRSAEVYDRTGRTAEAIREYAAFVELWKDCDPELQPVVETARTRLRALGGKFGTARTAVVSP